MATFLIEDVVVQRKAFLIGRVEQGVLIRGMRVNHNKRTFKINGISKRTFDINGIGTRAMITKFLGYRARSIGTRAGDKIYKKVKEACTGDNVVIDLDLIDKSFFEKFFGHAKAYVSLKNYKGKCIEFS